MSTSIHKRQAWIKYVVYVSPYRTERELESKGENYFVRIYLYSEDPAALQKIVRVVYRFGPELPYRIIESADRQNNFDCKIFTNKSFEFEFQVYHISDPLPYGDRYEVNISRPDERGYPISL